MKQFCKTSSIFDVDNIKNETILRDFLQKWKVECRADGLLPMRFAIFSLHLSKVLRLPRKVMPDHTKCCTCHVKSSQQTWRSEAPKRNPSQEISARTTQHLWWTCLLHSACHGKCIFADPLEMSHACHRFGNATKPSRLLAFDKVHNPLRLPRPRNDIWTSKSGPNRQFFLHFLTWKCASRHNGVHFLDISTSKNALNLSIFYTFDFEMCFAPQRRALFRHRNF